MLDQVLEERQEGLAVMPGDADVRRQPLKVHRLCLSPYRSIVGGTAKRGGYNYWGTKNSPYPLQDSRQPNQIPLCFWGWLRCVTSFTGAIHIFWREVD